jgi:hypothetical protein
MTRRRVLVVGGVAAAGIAAGGAVRLIDGGGGSPLRAIVPEALRGSGIRAVGEAYLRERPGDRGAAVLARLLRRRAAWREPLDSPDVPGVLAAESRADFRAGRTVHVDGWVLSETEARAAALAARPG